MSAIDGEYVTFKHIKTRKVVVLEIEVPEERFQEVISTLGMPIGGESKPVAIALLDGKLYNKPLVVGKSDIQENPGNKYHRKAIMLCKDANFHSFCHNITYSPVPQYDGEDFFEYRSRAIIYGYCNIKSRSELITSVDAQIKFKEMLELYKNWQIENNYKDNLERI